MKKTFFLVVGLSVFAGVVSAADPVDYLRDIKPILVQSCISCHGPQKQQAGLRLDTAKLAIEGGNTGPAIAPGKSSDSLLFKAVTAAAGVKAMPPQAKNRLSPQQIALVKEWIDSGAKAPATETVDAGPVGKTNHWAFQPVRRVAPPTPSAGDGAWARNPIDQFILAKLHEAGLKPSPQADRVTLLRRVSLDLTGLPPTPEEIEAALSEPSDQWYEKVVDRLLNSPHYGERWGRHWLDLARYADSNGYTIDAARSIWKYRDWVIDAFNRDLPFDRFTIEQLAGDMLPNATPDQRVATGFHRNTQINQEGGIDVEQFRVEAIVDRVNTTGQVWLGITIGCCQCHDHKYDPFSQREYYQLFAFLNNADEPTIELATAEEIRRRQQLKAQVASVEKAMKLLDIAPPSKERDWEKSLTADVRIYFPDEIQRILALAPGSRDNKMKQMLTAFYLQANHVPTALGGIGNPLPFLSLAHLQSALGRSTLDQHRGELRKLESAVVTTMVLQERKTPRVTNVMIQGDFTRKGVQVGPGVPGVLNPLPGRPPAGPGVNRLDLARWIVDPANPLTARVTMNRMWMHHFGIGIVETENDFGTQGTPPSHPELLDWLASEFIRQGWSMKAMHRLIVTSAVYRQSSQYRDDLLKVDARNRLLARQNRVRLEAEVVRDVALASSGLLTRKIGGPSVFPPQPDGVYRFTQVNRGWKADTGPDRYRRGMYTFFWRSAPHPGLTVFDAPDASMTCTRRNRSNTPLQALTLLNDEAYVEFAQALAARVLREAPGDAAARIRHAYLVCLGRPPSPVEETRLAAFLKDQTRAFESRPQEAQAIAGPGPGSVAERAAWTMLARAILNLDEFITRE
jgi:mono/diheme cytochrome c family protein